MAKLFSIVFLFAILFCVGATWVSPRLLTWYATPPVSLGVTCEPTMRWAMEKMMIGQAVGAAIGAVLGLLIYLSLRKRSKQRTAQSPQSAKP